MIDKGVVSLLKKHFLEILKIQNIDGLLVSANFFGVIRGSVLYLILMQNKMNVLNVGFWNVVGKHCTSRCMVYYFYIEKD